MPTVRNRVLAAGGDFDGTAGKGLVRFPELDDAGPESAMRVQILSVSYTQEEGTAPIDSAHLYVFYRDATATDYQSLRRWIASDAVVEFYLPCRYCIPRPPINDPITLSAGEWELIFKTSGKTEDATLIVDYGFAECDLANR